MSGQIKDAAWDIARVFIFEHWARFYYAVDRDGQVWLEVPDEVLESCRREHPDLIPLIEELNGQAITYESTHQHLAEFVYKLLDGSKYPPGLVANTLDSKPFQLEQYLFSLWLKAYGGYVESQTLSYDQWLESYQEWKATEEVQKYLAKLQAPKAVPQPGTDTVH
jgi:hypothetical protein